MYLFSLWRFCWPHRSARWLQLWGSPVPSSLRPLVWTLASWHYLLWFLNKNQELKFQKCFKDSKKQERLKQLFSLPFHHIWFVEEVSKVKYFHILFLSYNFLPISCLLFKTVPEPGHALYWFGIDWPSCLFPVYLLIAMFLASWIFPSVHCFFLRRWQLCCRVLVEAEEWSGFAYYLQGFCLSFFKNSSFL